MPMTKGLRLEFEAVETPGAAPSFLARWIPQNEGMATYFNQNEGMAPSSNGPRRSRCNSSRSFVTGDDELARSSTAAGRSVSRLKCAENKLETLRANHRIARSMTRHQTMFGTSLALVRPVGFEPATLQLQRTCRRFGTPYDASW